ncbi:MAG: hypothetical protein UY87_C0007G0017 [Candidatus Peribacteria bacterium GW2011_GWC2_54_8]|nr:MAG: hypothetical protein UY87_C0007G0017 [Candidatus Peribacteria bacterium GW2011_GWC2_54_8]
MNGKEETARETNPFLLGEEEDEPCNKDGVRGVEEKITQVVDHGVRPSDEEVDLIREECERDVQFRVVGSEDSFECCRSDCPHGRVIVDEQSVIPPHERMKE